MKFSEHGEGERFAVLGVSVHVSKALEISRVWMRLETISSGGPKRCEVERCSTAADCREFVEPRSAPREQLLVAHFVNLSTMIAACSLHDVNTELFFAIQSRTAAVAVRAVFLVSTVRMKHTWNSTGKRSMYSMIGAIVFASVCSGSMLTVA